MDKKEVERNKKVIEFLKELMDTLQEVGRIPNGHLYAQLMPHISLQTYESIIDGMKANKLIEVNNHEIIWIGK